MARDFTPYGVFPSAYGTSPGAGNTRVVTTKEDDKGTTQTEVVTGADGSKKTISDFFPSIVPSMEEIVAKNLSERDILTSNKEPGPVMGDAGYANANNTMTMPVTPFGEKSASGKAIYDDASMLILAEDLNNKRIAARMAKDAISKEQNMASRHPEGKGFLASLFDRDRLDQKFKLDDSPSPILSGLADRERMAGFGVNPESIERGYFGPGISPSEGEVNRGQEEAEELFALENPQTWTPEVVEKILSKSTLTGDADRDKDGLPSTTIKERQILANSKAAQESLDILRQQLKTLKSKDNYKVNSQEAYLDFLRENNVLKDFRPDLYKALAGAAFGMLMGQDIDDAFYNSFGGMQAEKDLKAAEDLKFEREKEIEMLKKSGKSSGGAFDKSAQFYNIGTDIEPIRVSATQLPNGNFLVVMPDGGKREVNPNTRRPDGTPVIRKWYTKQEINERVQANSDRLTSNLASIISQYQNEYELDDKQVEKLNSNIVAKAEVDSLIIDAMYTKGISFGPNMGLSTEGLMSGAIKDLISYRLAGGKTKTLSNIFDDTLIKADMNAGNLNESSWLLPGETYEDRNGKEQDVGKMPDKAFKDTLVAVEDYIQQLKDSGELTDIENITTNRQMFRLAEGRYNDWKASAEEKDFYAVRDAALKEGYTPFMYWFISGGAKKY